MEDNVCVGPIIIGVIVLVIIIIIAWQSAKKEAENKSSLQDQLKKKINSRSIKHTISSRLG